MVTLPGDVVRQYERFSLYNSPYPSHDGGHAIDLYPGAGDAVSPVSGEVLSTRTVRCPPQPYAVDEDHLILVDCGGVVARILHVDPDVGTGDVLTVGDELGSTVRSGFFGRWVDDHLHLGFRRPEQDLERASGSLPLDVDVTVAPVQWDGEGRVVETGPAHALLDAPTGDGGDGDRRETARGSGSGGGSSTGTVFAALASDEGVPLDGGLPHYAGGGVLGETPGAEVSLLGTPVGTVTGRDVAWADVAVTANGSRATGLSLFASRVPFGAKMVFHRGHDLSVGDAVTVAVKPTTDPVELG